MKKSINLYFNEDGREKEKLLLIKKAGFDEFFTGYNDDGCGFNFKEQCAIAKSIGLKCTMIHCKYNPKKLHYFWEEGVKGEELCDYYIKQIKESSGLSDNFVIHLNGRKSQKQTKIGLTRLKKILKVCDKYDMNLCVENLVVKDELFYIFNNIKHKKLKICFDVGHQNCFTPDLDVLKNFGKYVQVLHIHDNHGEKDEHLMCGKGNINWKKFAQDIKCFPNLVLASEVKYAKEKNSKIIKQIYKSLNTINKQVEKARV